MKIRLFLDQMIDIDVAQSLRVDGFDVQCTVDVNMSGANDFEILRHFITGSILQIEPKRLDSGCKPEPAIESLDTA